jgi:hypothetical protein
VSVCVISGVVSSLQTIERCVITVISVSYNWNKVKERRFLHGLKPRGFRAENIYD